MNIVVLNCNAFGYYSEAEYNEYTPISEEYYNKNKDKIDNISVSIYELDGKHSEVEADILVNFYKEDELANYNLEFVSDGYWLYDKLQDICEDLDEEYKRVQEYINSIDYMTEMKITCKKSDREKVLKFVEELNKNK